MNSKLLNNDNNRLLTLEQKYIALFNDLRLLQSLNRCKLSELLNISCFKKLSPYHTSIVLLTHFKSFPADVITHLIYFYPYARTTLHSVLSELMRLGYVRAVKTRSKSNLGPLVERIGYVTTNSGLDALKRVYDYLQELNAKIEKNNTYRRANYIKVADRDKED